MANEASDPLAGLVVKDEHLRRVLQGLDFLVQDGAMGTMLQQRGLTAGGEPPDLLCITHPDDVTAVHRAYVEAGAEMVTTNTFGANARKLAGHAAVEQVYAAAAACARASGARYVAGDIGPTGELLEPYGDLEPEEAYELFAQQARAAADAGCDLIAIETMTDLTEAREAVRAAHENCSLPVFATMSFGETGRTLFGVTPQEAVITLVAAGAQAVGVNCSVGPDKLVGVVNVMADSALCPTVARPNAGLPQMRDGQTVYDVTPDEFAHSMRAIIESGATIVGGCCGTTPAHLAGLAQLVAAHLE